MHQVWYEDPVSLGQKYQMAAKLKLRGVGFYCASGSWPDRVTGSDAAVAAMWASVRENFVEPHETDLVGHVPHEQLVVGNYMPIEATRVARRGAPFESRRVACKRAAATVELDARTRDATALRSLRPSHAAA